MRIAVLLNGSIKNDARVIKVIDSFSKAHFVDLFYIEGDLHDKSLFNNKVRLFPYPKPSGIFNTVIRHSFFYNEFNFYKKKVLNQNIPYDYIYANDLPNLKPALQIKREIKSRVIYDSHEIYNETLNQFFPDSTSFIKKIIFKGIIRLMTTFGNIAERKMVNKVDHFITTCESFKNYFNNIYNIKNISVVMNCPILNKDYDSIDLHKILKITKEKKIVLFQGRMNKGRALFKLIDTFKYVQQNIILCLIGSGTLENSLKAYSKQPCLRDKIYFIDEVPQTELLSYTRGANIGINLQEPINLSKKLASANKIFEYMHAGIPIIASDTPENIRIINEYSLGLITENTPMIIAEKINNLANANCKRMRLNSTRASEKYNWQNQEKILLSIFT